MGKKRHTRARPNKYLSDDDRKNELMEEYYKGQFQWDDQQWDLFYGTMRRELPATFRVTGFREQSAEVQWLIKNKFLDNLIDQKKIKVEDVKVEDEEKENNDIAAIGNGAPLAKALSWYPGEMAWQLNASKMEIRKTAELKRLHQFLISETDSGFISRQEAVSMLPPLLLDIEEHHKVLDICAAPGSKTAQLVEMLHAAATTKGGPNALPTGVVVANDIDSKRCYMTVHQLQRLQSPCVAVLRHDASIFPRLFLPDAQNKRGESPLVFDRILADVPCSGDGTLRKNQDLWPRWSPFLGINEHFLQMKILRRSLEMLAEGGRMVYSTCSLNPIEDEAVIASVLSQCGSAARLVDISDRLEGLIAEPGLSSWRVMLKDRTWCDSLDDVPQEQKRSLRQTLFSPENIDQLHIDRCRRILPQHQNTGGFFVALIEKVSTLPWMNSGANRSAAVEEENAGAVETTTTTTATTASGPPAKKARVFREDPFYYIDDDSDESWQRLRQFYGISEAFPHRQLMFRSAEGKRRNYYFTNGLLRQLVQTNATRDIHFVNLGVKVFGLSEDKLFRGYRLLQEGVETLAPFLGSIERRLPIGCREDLLTLLSFDMPLIDSFSGPMQEAFARCTAGPVLFQYEPVVSADGDALPRIPLRFAGWRGRSSLRHYVGLHERSHLLRLCGIEPVDVMPAARKSYGAADEDKLASSADEDMKEEQQIEEQLE